MPEVMVLFFFLAGGGIKAVLLLGQLRSKADTREWQLSADQHLTLCADRVLRIFSSSAISN